MPHYDITFAQTVSAGMPKVKHVAFEGEKAEVFERFFEDVRFGGEAVRPVGFSSTSDDAVPTDYRIKATVRVEANDLQSVFEAFVAKPTGVDAPTMDPALDAAMTDCVHLVLREARVRGKWESIAVAEVQDLDITPGMR